ncbi:hypothetical protein HK405_012130 [Cladochytrium tenue]|nr:hypothetical protein HK405_012130 [Cladochytrium tenue]
MLPSLSNDSFATAATSAGSTRIDAAAGAAPALLPTPPEAPTLHAFSPLSMQPWRAPAPVPTSTSPTSHLWPPPPDSLANPSALLALADSSFFSNFPVAPPPQLPPQPPFLYSTDGRRVGGQSLYKDYNSVATASAAAVAAAAAAAATTAASLPPSVLQQLVTDHLLLRQLHANYKTPFSSGPTLPFPTMPLDFPLIPRPHTLDPFFFAAYTPSSHQPPDSNVGTPFGHPLPFAQPTSFASLAYSASDTPQQPPPTFSLLHSSQPPLQGSSRPQQKAQEQQPSSSQPPPLLSASSRKTICQHARRRTQCVDCYDLGFGGGSICVHRKRRDSCSVCRAMRNPASGTPSLQLFSPASSDPQDPAAISTSQRPKRKSSKHGSLAAAAAAVVVYPAESRWLNCFPSTLSM